MVERLQCNMEDDDEVLPVEILVFILTLLPVKSLIQFTCVSKRFRSIILFDPKFAEAQFKAAFEHQTLTQRLLFATVTQLQSLDLDTPSFGEHSSLRDLTPPFRPRDRDDVCVSLLGSSNGIVFLALDHYKEFYMWNPCNGFFKRLPGLDLPAHEIELNCYGVGYVPASDDYKVFITTLDIDEDGRQEGFLYSVRVKAWRRFKVFVDSPFSELGVLLNEALHWVDTDDQILAFDLGDDNDKLREISLPSFDDDGGNRYYLHLGVSAEGFLTLAHYSVSLCDVPSCIDVWVMTEYGESGSWKKLFNWKVSGPSAEIWWRCPILLVMETSMVAKIYTKNGEGLIKIDHKKEGKCVMYKVEHGWYSMIRYQETLLRIDG